MGGFGAEGRNVYSGMSISVKTIMFVFRKKVIADRPTCLMIALKGTGL